MNTELGLNPEGSDKKSIFLFYILFVVGQSEGNLKGLADVNKILKEKFGNGTIVISDELSDNLLIEMLETEG